MHFLLSSPRQTGIAADIDFSQEHGIILYDKRLSCLSITKKGDVPMLDLCGRSIDYLRLSVTDLCNYRCQYCMPADGVAKRPHTDMLSIEELVKISEACIANGVKTIRLTGNKPTLISSFA